MAIRKIAKPANDALATPESVAAQEFDAAITEQQLQELEENAHGFGINRRIALAILARSKAQLVAPLSKDDNAAQTSFDIFEAVDGYIRHLKGMMSLAETAKSRSLVVCAATSLARDAAGDSP